MPWLGQVLNPGDKPDSLVDDMGNLSIDTETDFDLEITVGPTQPPSTQSSASQAAVANIGAQGATANVSTQNFLIPLSHIHDNYELANIHPRPDIRKRMGRDVSKLFRLFCYLLKPNGFRQLEFYLGYHDYTPEDLASLLNMCKLPSWIIAGRTESLFEGRWHIVFRCTAGLGNITEDEFNKCTQ